MSSTNDSIALKAAVEISRLPATPQDDIPPPLPKDVYRVYPLPPFEDDDSRAFEAELDRLAARDSPTGDPKAHHLDHYQAALDLVYPAAKPSDVDE